MEIRKIPITELKAAEYNPRKELKPTDKEYQAIKHSLDSYGYCTPIVWNEATGNIVSGHQRFNILKQSGATEIEVSVVNLDDAKEKELNLALNKISGIWDDAKLELLVCELQAPVMELMGFDDIIEKQKKVEEDEFDVEAELENITEPICKLGDIWQLGKHRLMCGDSCDSDSVARLMDGAVADMICTDPPYNVDYKGGKGKVRIAIENDNMSDSNFKEFLQDSFRNMSSSLKAGGGYYIWHADMETIKFRTAANENIGKVRTILIWSKHHFCLGRQDYQWQHEPCLYGWKKGATHSWYSDRKQTTIIKFDRPTKSKLHPTMKPVGLIEYLIKNSSKQEDIILDPFLGSGTTLMACEKLQRFCYGIELDPKYCDVIIKRWQQFTGKEAIHEQSGKKYNSI